MSIYLECRECDMRELFPEPEAVQDSAWTDIGGPVGVRKGCSVYVAYCVNHSDDR